jgi:putative hemolysin
VPGTPDLDQRDEVLGRRAQVLAHVADELADQLGLRLPPSRDYATVAGLVIAALQHLPETGETCEIAGWRFEVVDLDGRRVDKLLATRLEEVEAE